MTRLSFVVQSPFWELARTEAEESIWTLITAARDALEGDSEVIASLTFAFINVHTYSSSQPKDHRTWKEVKKKSKKSRMQ
jgi:hypothetical protein